ncbi:ATP-binding protein [Halomonas sp. I1]|uniref:AAA family ATPase n=1 Tax=Halomonas sp. I1 TaxID=393536 RepID=UPI0028DF44E9|nr:ATP-binding protein [Halomonas sp. I1]MDT8893366.1 ATP-binding protein [Halomonas sp. I1]
MSQRQPHDTLPREGDYDLASLLLSLCAWHGEHDTDDASCSLRAIRERMNAEIQGLELLMSGDEDRLRLSDLARWLEENIARLEPLLSARDTMLLPESWASANPRSRLLDEGRVLVANAIDRDLDGAGVDGPLDPASDVASLLVGLEVRDEGQLSHQALDSYLRISGDYELPRLLPVFRVIECLSGARRALRRREEAGDDEQPALLAETMSACRRYLDLAERYTEFRFPPLVIGVGVAGSGKSRFTRTLVSRLGAIRLCSDVERRRLHGIHPQEEKKDVPVDIFSDTATEKTYRRLAKYAGALLDAGLPVCIDGTCLKREQRDLLRHQAEGRGLPVLLISFEADEATLERRITKRAARQDVLAEESLAILARQREAFEDFSDEERLLLVRLDTTADNAAEILAGLIQEHVR